MKKSSLRLAGIAALAAMVMTACSTGGGADNGSNAEQVTLNVVGFAVPKAANNALQKKWAEKGPGANITWQETYGASGDQSRAVAAGLPADYVHFSLEGDVTRLVETGLVDENWKDGPNKGVVSQSVVVIVVPEGNPNNIQGWDDLIKPGVEIVTPNPGSSGAARWNILAAYAHVLANGGTDEDANEFVTKLFNNIVSLPGSGRDATTAFLAGTGNVLLSYENEAILAKQNGEKFDYFIPDTTLLIENPGAVLKKAHPKATEWLEFILTDEGQAEFAQLGFRPLVEVPNLVVEGANDPQQPFPTPKTLVTITDFFGGWPDTNKKYFDADTGLVTLIQQSAGK